VHRPRGLSWGGRRVLFVIWTAGPLEPKKAAELTGMSRAAVSALVTPLERDRLVTRDRALHDRRSVLLGLSERGSTVITDAFGAQFALIAAREAWAEAFDDNDRRTLIALLERLTAHCVDARRPAPGLRPDATPAGSGKESWKALRSPRSSPSGSWSTSSPWPWRAH
jgi:DNA-binding MarR family transcriptional regulator